MRIYGLSLADTDATFIIISVSWDSPVSISKSASIWKGLDTSFISSNHVLECYQLNSGMKALFIPAVNKVPGYWIQNKTDLANKPRNMQIFPHSKFGTDRSTGLKVMAKKLFQTQTNFLVITFKPVDQLIPNFECGKICMVGGLFANAVKLLMQ